MDDEMLSNADMNKFIERFEENYDFLYYHNDRVAGFGEAMEYGDMFISYNPGNFMSGFSKARGDIITSDRESAALAFTLDDFDLI